MELKTPLIIRFLGKFLGPYQVSPNISLQKIPEYLLLACIMFAC